MFLPYTMIICLLITIFIEFIVALILKIFNKKDLINVILVNILTNPLLVSLLYLIFLKLGANAKIIFEIIMEIIVLFVEGTIYNKYFKYKKINPYLVSLILNASSYFIGGIIIDKILNYLYNVA